MKAGLIFTGHGPILALISYPSFSDSGLVEKLKNKGIDKYAAREVPLDLCRERYGVRFQTVAEDLGEKNDLRILDYKSEHAFYTFKWEEMGEEVRIYSRDS